MNLSRSVLSELALLGDVRDSSSPDVSVTMSDLVAEMSRSLPSFVGLTVLVGDPETPVVFTTVDDAEQASRIRTSLRFSLHSEDPAGPHTPPSGVLTVYAATPGALVDLAADLAWFTGRAPSEAHLDEDLEPPGASSQGSSLARLSVANQAIGVLIGTGLSEEEAVAELHSRAIESGAARHDVAIEILASLPGRAIESGPEGPQTLWPIRAVGDQDDTQ